MSGRALPGALVCDCMTEDPGDGYGERVVTHSSSCPLHPDYTKEQAGQAWRDARAGSLLATGRVTDREAADRAEVYIGILEGGQ